MKIIIIQSKLEVDRKIKVKLLNNEHRVNLSEESVKKFNNEILSKSTKFNHNFLKAKVITKSGEFYLISSKYDLTTKPEEYVGKFMTVTSHSLNL